MSVMVTLIKVNVLDSYMALAYVDPRDKIRYDLTPEFAMKIGKLIGSEHKEIVFGVDCHPSSRMLGGSFTAGIMSTGGLVRIAKDSPAPTLPFSECDTDCYVTIGSDVNPESFSGMEIRHKNGSYFAESEIFAITSAEGRITYPPYNRLGRYGYADGCVENHLKKMESQIKGCECQVIIDDSFVTPTETTANALSYFGADTILLRRKNDQSIFPSIHETDHRMVANTMKSHENSIGIVLNSDGSAAVAFDEKREYINGEQIFQILVKFLEPKKVAVPLDMTIGLEDVFNGISIMTKNDLKMISDVVVSREADLGCDLNGHIIFPSMSYAPDGIMTSVKLAEIAAEATLSDIIEELPVYPTMTETVRVADDIEELMDLILENASTMEYESIVAAEAIRLNFDSGWILIRPTLGDDSITIMCEGRDKAYLIGLVEIGKNLVTSCIKSLD